MAKYLKLKQFLAKLVNCPLVVERGTTDIWTWRKWTDGTAECWGVYERLFGAGETVITLNLPFEFLDANYDWLGSVSDPMIGGSTAAYGTGVGCHIRTTTSFTFRYKTVSASSVVVPVYIYIIGKWAEVDPETSTMIASSYVQNQMTRTEVKRLIEGSGSTFRGDLNDDNEWDPPNLPIGD